MHLTESWDAGTGLSPGGRNRSIILFLGMISLILGGIALYAVQSVVVPLLVAWFLSQLLGPAVIFLTRHKIPTGVAVLIVVLLLVAALFWVGMFVSASAASFARDLPKYREQMLSLSQDLIARLTEAFPATQTPQVRAELNQQLARLISSLVGMLGNVVGLLTNVFAKLVMILIVLAFLLIERPYFAAKLQNALSAQQAERVGHITRDISRQISGYLFVQFFVSLVTGVLVWATCRVIGITSAVTWGALAFFLNFIPTIGSILAGIPPVLLALLQFYPSVWPAFWTIVAILAINQVLGNILAPRLLGDRLNLSPVVIIVSLLFWGWLWGFVGALLSVLITASIKIICDNVDSLAPIGIMMGSGRRSRS